MAERQGWGCTGTPRHSLWLLRNWAPAQWWQIGGSSLESCKGFSPGVENQTKCMQSHKIAYSAFQISQKSKQKLLLSSQHLIYSTTWTLHSTPTRAQALNTKENIQHTLENLWSSKLTYAMESHLLNLLKTWFKAYRHGGKFLHSLPSKSTLPSVISDNLMCLAADHSQAEHSHTIFIAPRSTRSHSQSWGALNSRVIPSPEGISGEWPTWLRRQDWKITFSLSLRKTQMRTEIFQCCKMI